MVRRPTLFDRLFGRAVLEGAHAAFLVVRGVEAFHGALEGVPEVVGVDAHRLQDTLAGPEPACGDVDDLALRHADSIGPLFGSVRPCKLAPFVL